MAEPTHDVNDGLRVNASAAAGHPEGPYGDGGMVAVMA